MPDRYSSASRRGSVPGRAEPCRRQADQDALGQALSCLAVVLVSVEQGGRRWAVRQARKRATAARQQGKGSRIRERNSQPERDHRTKESLAEGDLLVAQGLFDQGTVEEVGEG